MAKGTETLVLSEEKSPSGQGFRPGGLSGLLRQALARFRMRNEKTPIDSVDALRRFVSSRAAFVAQKKLYGYLKARMGTRFPSMFEDDAYVASINIAKMHVFAACLSDLAIHAVARVAAASGLPAAERAELAKSCYAAGIADNREHAPEGAEAGWLEAFEKRLANVQWENAASGGNAFVESPKALLRWAPIADELKRYDREIVENSITFAWPEQTREFARRAAPQAVIADWLDSGARSADPA